MTNTSYQPMGRQYSGSGTRAGGGGEEDQMEYGQSQNQYYNEYEKLPMLEQR